MLSTKKATTLAAVIRQPSIAHVKTTVTGLKRGDMKMKAVVVPRRGAPVSFSPLAMGVVAQEQPGRSAAAPTATNRGLRPLPPIARSDHFRGKNACSAAPATAPQREKGRTFTVRTRNSWRGFIIPTAAMCRTASDTYPPFQRISCASGLTGSL